MKYDAQISSLTPTFSGAQSILLLLPKELTIDHLASSLAFYLALKQAGRQVSIATEGAILVGHSHLFGVGDIQDKLPLISGGNYTLTLGGVVAPDTSGQPIVPALEKLDWRPQGQDLKLIFHVLPGKQFNPTFVTPSFEGGKYDLIIVIGASSLVDLGNLYGSNPQTFSGAPLVNIDNKSTNSQFGTTSVVDPESSSLSEMVAQIISALGLVIDQDIASNILTGIYDATANLQSPKASAATFEAVAQALKAGGKKPEVAQPVTPTPTASPAEPTSVPQPQPATSPTPGFDLNQLFGAPSQPVPAPQDNFNLSPSGIGKEQKGAPQPSPEETPRGEKVETETPEADWLTPKIFKGGSVG